MIINKYILYIYLQLNQWKNTKAITNWFTVIPNKNNTAFIQFDITEHTLDGGLDLAAQHVPVSHNDIRNIKHCCKSLLFHDGKPWIKKLNHLFDVTMGSFDGVEMCELVGALILSQLSRIINNTDMGLYRRWTYHH